MKGFSIKATFLTLLIFLSPFSFAYAATSYPEKEMTPHLLSLCEEALNGSDEEIEQGYCYGMLKGYVSGYEIGGFVAISSLKDPKEQSALEQSLRQKLCLTKNITSRQLITEFVGALRKRMQGPNSEFVEQQLGKYEIYEFFSSYSCR